MKIKVPYTLSVLFPIIGWSVLCSAFAYILIITIAKFNDPMASRAFVAMTPIYVLLFCLLAILRYNGNSFMAGDDIRLLNFLYR